MGRELYDASAKIREMYAQANEILGYDLTKICFEGPAEVLDATDQSQPAIFLTSLAALEALKESEPEALENCVATTGLSLGEYTALTFAGVMSFEDGLKLDFRSVMGVEIPVLTMDENDDGNQLHYGTQMANSAVDNVYIHFTKVKELTVELAEIENRTVYLCFSTDLLLEDADHIWRI